MSDNLTHESRRRARRLPRIILGAITMILIVALFVGLGVYTPVPNAVDFTSVTSASVSRLVSPTQSTVYCPARMALSDDAKYGDSEFQSSSGDLASSAVYAAFGSVYSAQVTPMNDESSDTLELKADDLLDQASLKVATGNADKGSRLIEARLLKARSGTGALGSVASWATKGDLQGLSAAACTLPGLTQSFLLSATDTGTTQQLIVANPSSKATSLDVSIWGTQRSGRIAMSTGSTMVVAAHGQSTLNIGAAASDQMGLFVTVASKQTPVAAVVRTVRMSGLTPQGEDFAVPVGEAGKSGVMPSIVEGDHVTITAFGSRSGSASLSWITQNGASAAKKVHVDAGRVTSVDLGSAPVNAMGVSYQADVPVSMQATVTHAGEGGNEDFAFVCAAAPLAGDSAIALPDRTEADITIVNTSGSSQSTSVQGYDIEGKSAGSRSISLDAHGVVRISASDVNKNARLFSMSGNTSLVWGARLSQTDVTAAHLAAVAYLAPTSLEPRMERVWAASNPLIVR